MPVPLPFNPGGSGANSGSPVTLQLLLNAIPTAQEGHVISSEYHNSLRTALLFLAQQLGPGVDVQERTITLAPTFYRNGNLNEWNQLNGIASARVGASTNGLLPLHLPEGARLNKMVVIGRKKGVIDGLLVNLLRQSFKGVGVTTPLITIPLEDAPASFAVEGKIEISGLGANAAAAALEDFALVRNNLYKYMITAEADNPTELAEIHAIQITYMQ